MAATEYTELRLVRSAEATHDITPEIVGGRAPYSILTEEGIRQAQHLGRVWADQAYYPDAAHTSPHMRANNTLQVAQTVQFADNKPSGFVVRAELAEQCLGYHEGRERDEVYNPYTSWMIELQGALYQHQGRNQEGVLGESLLSTARRMVAYAASLSELEAGHNRYRSVVAISHDISIKSMVSYLELGGAEQTPNPHELLALTLGRQALAPCSETILIIESDPARKPHIDIEHVGRPIASS